MEQLNLGDSAFNAGNVYEAIEHYSQYLLSASYENRTSYKFNSFANRYYKLKKVADKNVLNSFIENIRSVFYSELSPLFIKMEVEVFFKIENIFFDKEEGYKTILNNEYAINFNHNCVDDKFFDEFAKNTTIDFNRPKRIDILFFLLDYHILNRVRSEQTKRIDEYAVSLYEKLEKFDKALKIAEECLNVKINAMNVRTIYRICRKKQDYTIAERVYELLLLKEFNINGSFDILYELVYYYDFCKDVDKRNEKLDIISKSFEGNKPIQKTLQNFYITFGETEKAEILAKNEIKKQNIKKNKHKNSKDIDAEAKEIALVESIEETTEESFDAMTVRNQLALIAELTKGISHEFGQPITNIRYTVQFYSKVLEKKLDLETIQKIFASILQETERMGALVKRLNPITSTKNNIKVYNLLNSIQKIANATTARIEDAKIQLVLSGNTSIELEGDEVKFEQIISNLLFNAIDAIAENEDGKERKISIDISKIHNNKAKITFKDTGIGIAEDRKSKIFKPFYSTKAPDKGQGLGLFIVWNLLEYMGGSISLNKKYIKGASFELIIPLKSKEIELKNSKI